MNQHANRQVVLGIGVSQYGLNLLQETLARQPSSRFTLEQPPLLPWERDADLPGIKARIARWKSTGRDRLIGDAAAFYLPYVEAAIACEPGIRIICIKCPQDDFVAVFSRTLNENARLPVNHWAGTPGPDWFHDPLWTQTFPQYDIRDRADGMTRYWREYHERADDLRRRFPDNVIIVDDVALATEEGVRQVLDFAGMARESQVLVTGRRPPNVLASVEVMNVPVARYQNPFDPRKCVVLVPFNDFIHQECDAALKELERRGYQVRRVGGYAAIDQGRNQIATDALIHGFEETLWVDSDIGFRPDDVEKLRRHELPIACGIYPQKGKRAFACQFAAGTQRVTFGGDGGLLEIQYAGAGFLLIRREAYATIQQKLKLPVCNELHGRPMIPFFAPMVRPVDDGHSYLAEDFSFCERARQVGFRIVADTSIRLWHIGKYRYGWEDAGLEQTRHDSFTLNAVREITD